MGDVMEVIKERRSIRNYQDKDVPDEVINELLEAVRWTPSWANTQCWEVIVVKDSLIKEQLQATLAKGNPATKSMVAAPVIMGICGKLKSSGYYKEQQTTKFGDWFMFDLGLATQTLCLAAHNLGLGTVIVGLFDHDKVKQILELPEGIELVALVPLGYPSKTPSAPKRKELNEFVHYDKFQPK